MKKENQNHFAFLNPDNFSSPYDKLSNPEYALEQYKEGLKVGKEAKTFSVNIYNVWSTNNIDGSSTNSSEKIGYHAYTSSFLKGIIDSGVEIKVYRDINDKIESKIIREDQRFDNNLQLETINKIKSENDQLLVIPLKKLGRENSLSTQVEQSTGFKFNQLHFNKDEKIENQNYFYSPDKKIVFVLSHEDILDKIFINKIKNEENLPNAQFVERFDEKYIEYTLREKMKNVSLNGFKFKYAIQNNTDETFVYFIKQKEEIEQKNKIKRKTGIKKR